MTHNKTWTKPEYKVGLFVTFGVLLIMFSILILGEHTQLLSKKNYYTVHFSSIDGLIAGAKVSIGGIQIGIVESTELNQNTQDIEVKVVVARKFAPWIRNDSGAEILTQGMLGDKFLSITAGSQNEPELKDGSSITPKAGKDLTQFISKGDQLLVTLTSIAGGVDRLLKTLEASKRSELIFQGFANTAQNLALVTKKFNDEFDHLQLKQTGKNLNQILEKINSGTGTVGALINDPSLYYDLKSLTGSVNRNKIIRNLVRKTVKEGDSNP